MTNLERARNYFSALEARADLGDFFCSDVSVRTLPNRLLPNGATSDLAALVEAQERGKKAVSHEHYEIINAVELGEQLALEVIWTGTVAVPLGSVPAGGTLRAHFAVFLRFREGRILTQHNYDCFEPF